MVIVAAGSCGGKTPATNGETHFLCAKDADCVSVGPDYTCKSGYCQIENASNDDGGGAAREARISRTAYDRRRRFAPASKRASNWAAVVSSSKRPDVPASSARTIRSAAPRNGA